MAIVWGKKRVEKALGHAADFCPICRDITPHRISRLGVAGHLYFVALGEGELVGHVGECTNCKTKRLVDSRKYKTFLFAPGNDIEKLIKETYPKLRLDRAERLEIEKKIKENHTFSHEEREVLLIEPFKHLSGKVEERYANAKFDKESDLGCLITIAALVISPCLSIVISQTDTAQNILSLSSGLIFIFGFIYTVVQLMLSPNRFVKREITPILAKALAPLNPQKVELQKCLNFFKTGGHRLGQKINENQLWEQIQKYRSP
ncbi:MAG: hypothetical protein U0V18_09955 [Anaerolineales bacterium]